MINRLELHEIQLPDLAFCALNYISRVQGCRKRDWVKVVKSNGHTAKMAEEAEGSIELSRMSCADFAEFKVYNFFTVIFSYSAILKILTEMVRPFRQKSNSIYFSK